MNLYIQCITQFNRIVDHNCRSTVEVFHDGCKLIAWHTVLFAFNDTDLVSKMWQCLWTISQQLQSSKIILSIDKHVSQVLLDSSALHCIKLYKGRLPYFLTAEAFPSRCPSLPYRYKLNGYRIAISHLCSHHTKLKTMTTLKCNTYWAYVQNDILLSVLYYFDVIQLFHNHFDVEKPL